MQKIKDILDKYKLLSFLIFIYLFSIFFYHFFITPPKSFKENAIVEIKVGQGLSSISSDLKNNGFIKSKILFQSFLILLGGEKKVIAGDYLFKEKENVFTVAKRILKGDYGFKQVRITIPEGFANEDIIKVLKENIIDFDEMGFRRLVKNKEGYLFPDTYFFSPTANSDEILKKIEGNFETKITKFKDDLEKSGKSLKEILTMASILEGEAKDKESREIVSGILWRRISLKLPLQVDATFKYINGKGTSELTLDDLKINSPYNTYNRLGLPPTPINNPGEETIHSALNPKKTPYLYFLTGKDGKMYYAKTFEEHKRNKEKYLR
jgi:UPF0755 protein